MKNPMNRSKETQDTTGNQASTEVGPRKLHIVNQGKGGAGKTFVASLLCQAYLDKAIPYLAFDLDPVNRSLAAIKGLNAEPWEVLDGGGSPDVNPEKFDLLVEEIINAKSDVILDLGATGFIPFNNYLETNKVLELLRKNANIETTIHCVVRGGSSLLECLSGMKKICENYSEKDASIYIWLNGVEGEIEFDGKTFTQMQAYESVQSRIAQIVTINEEPSKLQRNDITSMLSKHLTFKEAIDSNHTLFVAKWRLGMLKKKLVGGAANALGLGVKPGFGESRIALTPKTLI